MAATSSVGLGSALMVASNLMYSIGAFVADWSVTHVLNPNWPPHARFHNGQTMTLGVLLSSSSLYFLFRPCNSIAARKDSLRTSAMIGCFYSLSALTAIWYPGTDWSDPEYANGRPQLYLFSGLIFTNMLGYWLETQRIGKEKSI
ncbi:hypothetical protein MBLNU459_g8113t1 [Dothideomycetes sp. NU459]